jgi:hypothetical protein
MLTLLTWADTHRVHCIEWRIDLAIRRNWYVCDQQAAAKQADMAVFPAQVGRLFPLATNSSQRLHNMRFSGPKRYDYVASDDSWRYSRDDVSLKELLNEELGMVFGQPVEVLSRR